MSDLASEETGSAKDWRIYDPTTDIDLLSVTGRRCRVFSALVSGTIVLVLHDDTEVTIPDGAPVGKDYIAQAKTLKGESTCTSVYVGW